MSAASGMTLDLLPKLALLVRFDAPLQVFVARRVGFERRQSWVDWPHKFELQTQLRSIEAMRELYQSLPRRAAPSIDVQCTDKQTRDEAFVS